MRAMALIAAGLLVAVPALADTKPSPPALPGNQQILIPHVGGRTVPGTAMVRQQNGIIIATTETYQWPGTYFEAAFTGPEMWLRLNDNANILTVNIDDQLKDTLNRPGEVLKRYTGLGPGRHIVRLDRLTETQDATGTFEGFFAPAGSGLAVLPRARQIEFIGDSFSAGYGNTSSKRDCTQAEVWATTDTQQAFGPQVAHHFNADYQINAYSGIGVVRNYNGVAPKRNMPLLYRSALIEDATVHAYSDPSWNPAIVVIALGGNDFSTPVHAGEKWANDDDLRTDLITAYAAFVQQVRASHPKAQFILMDYGEDKVASVLAEVITRLNAVGETRIRPFSTGGGFSRTGCDWHLNLDDDHRIAEAVESFIERNPDLWSE